MIQQPGNTNLDKEEVTGKFREAFSAIFDAINEYHSILGTPSGTEGSAVAIEKHRQFCLAIMMEVGELVEAVPWKPWRPEGYKDVDLTNVVEEMIDIIFFLGSIRRLWWLSPEQMADVLERKLIENYRRIQIGYNRKVAEMEN